MTPYSGLRGQMHYGGLTTLMPAPVDGLLSSNTGVIWPITCLDSAHFAGYERALLEEPRLNGLVWVGGHRAVMQFYNHCAASPEVDYGAFNILGQGLVAAVIIFHGGVIVDDQGVAIVLPAHPQPELRRPPRQNSAIISFNYQAGRLYTLAGQCFAYAEAVLAPPEATIQAGIPVLRSA